MLRYDPRHRRQTDSSRHTRRSASRARTRHALERLEERLALTVELSGAPSVDEGSAYVLTLGGYDAPSQAAVETYRVNWGDGNIIDYAAGDVIADLGEVQHTYADGAAGGTNRTISVAELDEFDQPIGGGGGLGLDSAFGAGGVTITDYLSLSDMNVAIAQWDDHFISFAVTAGSDFSFVRYLADGTLDTTFGTGGRVVFDMPHPSWGITTGLAIDDQGRILIAGTVESFFEDATPSSSTGSDVAVARYNPDGSLDYTFGYTEGPLSAYPGGVAVYDVGEISGDEGKCVALDGDGNVLVGGLTYNGIVADLVVVRFDGNGQFVDTFAAGMPHPMAIPHDMAVASDGSIVMIATLDDELSFITFTGVVAGTPVLVDLGGMSTIFPNLALDDQDRIYVAGGDVDLAVARYDADGVLDSTFGGGDGVLVIDVPGTDASANDVLIDDQGRIVLAGQTPSDLLVSRLAEQGGNDPLGVIVNNALPVAAAHAMNPGEDGASGINVLDDLFDAGTLDAHTAVPANFTTSLGGIVEILSDGTATYDPAGAFEHLAVGETAVDSFSYTIIDSDSGESLPALVSVTIHGVNDDPTADDDGGYSVTEDGVLTVSALAGVLVGDDDVDATDTLTVTVLAGPAHGTLALGLDGSFTYTPGATGDDLTSDSFTYTVSDGHGGSDVGTVSISITPAVADGTVVRTGSIVRVGGTSGSNNIVLTQSSGVLFKNGSSTGVSLTGATQIRVWGRDGCDVITLSGLSISAVIFGGAGNDVITANGGSDLLLGGDGLDIISGGNGSDLLVGGQGIDLLMAGNGNDIVVGGGLDDSALSIDALFGILNDWALAHDPDSSLTEEVTDGNGLGDIDMLSGGNGSDWFLLGDNDVIVDSNLNPDLITHV